MLKIQRLFKVLAEQSKEGWPEMADAFLCLSQLTAEEWREHLPLIEEFLVKFKEISDKLREKFPESEEEMMDRLLDSLDVEEALARAIQD